MGISAKRFSQDFEYLLAVCVFLTLSIGCGPKHPTVVPVTGKVMLDGQPFTKGGVATVTVAGRGASGFIRSDGTFQLSTFGKNDGAQRGKHKVLVAAYEDGGAGPEAGPGKLLIPQRYTDPETSGLVIEVSNDGPNEVVLELSTK